MQPLFWEIDITPLFSLLGNFFAEIKEIWQRFDITIGEYSFNVWGFIIVTFVINILVMRYFFDDSEDG